MNGVIDAAASTRAIFDHRQVGATVAVSVLAFKFIFLSLTRCSRGSWPQQHYQALHTLEYVLVTTIVKPLLIGVRSVGLG